VERSVSEWYDRFVQLETPADLSPEDRQWLIADEKRWREAHAIASRYDVDPGGVYRVLRNLEKTPTQRLIAALQHGRLFGLQAR